LITKALLGSNCRTYKVERNAEARLSKLRRAFADRDLTIPDHCGTGHSSKLYPAE